jgi:hypothetical protein
MPAQDPETTPPEVPDATEPSSDLASAPIPGSPTDVGTPVSRPIEATAGDGCSASPASPRGAHGSVAGASTLLLGLCTSVLLVRRRRRRADRASDCASRA